MLFYGLKAGPLLRMGLMHKQGELTNVPHSPATLKVLLFKIKIILQPDTPSDLSVSEETKRLLVMLPSADQRPKKFSSVV